VISTIRLQNYRSYRDESFEFEPGVNIVVGPNASGKTNLVEAALVLARGSSYKARDSDLVRRGAKWSRLDGFFGTSTRSVKLQAEGDTVSKSFIINSKNYHRLNLERSVPVVFFEPNHLQLITRGPEQRREYIDDLLERTRGDFKRLSASYRRALAQRNALLKTPPTRAKEQLFAWNIRLSELGAKIAQSRGELVSQINKNLTRTYNSIASQRSSLKLSYDSQFDIERYASRLLSKLESSVELDFARGFTAYGPHREDLTLYLNKQPMSQLASRGETRSLLLALKIFELSLVEKARGMRPVFLLDDVFSELDSARRRALVNYLKDQQTIITTTDADAVVEYFAGQHTIIPIAANRQ